jgi:hypothetical protein
MDHNPSRFWRGKTPYPLKCKGFHLLPLDFACKKIWVKMRQNLAMDLNMLKHLICSRSVQNPKPILKSKCWPPLHVYSRVRSHPQFISVFKGCALTGSKFMSQVGLKKCTAEISVFFCKGIEWYIEHVLITDITGVTFKYLMVSLDLKETAKHLQWVGRFAGVSHFIEENSRYFEVLSFW